MHGPMNDFVLPAEKETVSATGYARLTDIGKTCGMEMRFSRPPPPQQITTDQNQLENVEYFNY